MVIVPLPSNLITQVIRWPESGMGYHRVRITLQSGEVIRCVVLGDRELYLRETIDTNTIIKIEQDDTEQS